MQALSKGHRRSTLVLLGLTCLLTVIFSLVGARQTEPSLVEWLFFLVAMVATGIPHGATDHVLAKIDAQRRERPYSDWRFLGNYLAVMAVFTVCWAVAPKLSLAFFLIVSAYHFGQSQLFYAFQGAVNPVFSAIVYTMWGGFVLSLVTLLNFEESRAILATLYPEFASDGACTAFFQPNAALIVSSLGVAAFLSLTLSALSGKLPIADFGLEVLTLVCLAALCHYTGLLVSFAGYFGLWHASKSIDEIRSHFHANRLSGSLRGFYEQAARFSLLSFVGLGLVLVAVFYLTFPVSPLLVFFILLSAVTMPHTFIIDRIYRKPSG